MSEIACCVDCGGSSEIGLADLSEGPLCRKCFMARSMDNRVLTARCTGMGVWCEETQQWKQVYP